MESAAAEEGLLDARFLDQRPLGPQQADPISAASDTRRASTSFRTDPSESGICPRFSLLKILAFKSSNSRLITKTCTSW